MPGLEGPYYDPSCSNGLDDDCDRMTDGEDPDCTDTCSGALRDLADEMYASDQACTAVVRLDYQTKELIGFQLVCGPYAQASCEPEPYMDVLSPPDAEDECVFYVSPMDWGWAAAVHSAVVLLYPRTVGAFDPTTAEWIVLINGGL